MKTTLVAALCLSSALLVSVCNAASTKNLMMQVEPKTEDCVFEDIPEGTKVDAKVLVMRGGKLDVRLRVTGPRSTIMFDQLIFSGLDEQTGQALPTIVKKGHNFVATTGGEHAFCFDNRMSRWTAKVVSFELTLIPPTPAPSGDSAAAADEPGKPATVGRMQQSVDRVANKLVEIEGAQRYHYFRERRHRDTAESSNTRAMWCSIVEALALCLGTGINIYIVQTWFATPVKRSQV